MWQSTQAHTLKEWRDPHSVLPRAGTVGSKATGLPGVAASPHPSELSPLAWVPCWGFGSWS